MTTRTDTPRPGECLIEWTRGVALDTLVLGPTAAPVLGGTLVGIVTATGKLGPYDSAATDGRQVARGIAYASSPVSGYDQKILVIARQASVAANKLIGFDEAARVQFSRFEISIRVVSASNYTVTV